MNERFPSNNQTMQPLVYAHFLVSSITIIQSAMTVTVWRLQKNLVPAEDGMVYKLQCSNVLFLHFSDIFLLTSNEVQD